MPVILNLKRCDNVKECGAPTSCPTGAFYWDEKKRTLAVDIEKCTDCGACENACPSGAVLVVPDMEEYHATLRIIEQEGGSIKELFVDRYGAMTVDSTNEIAYKDVKDIIAKCSETIAIEVLDADNPSCLISAVPYAVLFGDKNIPLYKIMTSGDELKEAKKYLKLKQDPALILCKKGKVIAKYEGRVEAHTNEVEDLKAFIQKNA